MNILQYKVSEILLKPNGYTFQKLYAANYRTYRKQIDAYTIWLWSKGKSIEINDWHGFTGIILDFYKANRNHPEFDKFDMWGEKRDYIKVQCSRDERQIVQLFDNDEYRKVFRHEDINHAWDEWNAKYGNWSNEIILRRNVLDKVLKEIEWLQSEK